MTSKDESLESFFSTRFFFPAWWARAYEQASSSTMASLDPFEISATMGIAPALSAAELNALAVVASNIQRQILSNFSEEITFSPFEFQKHATTRNQAKLFNYIKLLQALPGIRFFSASEPNFFEPASPFRNERWSHVDKTLSLTIRDFGAEIFLGYSDPYVHIVRAAREEYSPIDTLGAEQPLAIWRSPWMELSGLDQAILFKVEKAMQWQCRWLHFDGVFGINLRKLVETLDFSSLKRAGGPDVDPLRLVLMAMEKVGKRLSQHGLLKIQVSDEYLALDEGDRDSLLLIWQASAEKIKGSDHEAYRRRCLRFLFDKKLAPRHKDLIRLVCFDAYDDFLGRKASECWQILQKLDPNLTLAPLAEVSGPSPLTAASLFFEWALRSIDRHRYPLPEEIQSSQLSRLTRIFDADTPVINEVFLKDRLSAFISSVRENSDFRICIEGTVGASFASRVTRDSPDFQRVLQTFRQSSLQVVTAKAETQFDQKPASSKEGPSQDRISEDADKRKSMTQQHMRRLASKELSLIKTSDSERYKQLKKTYFDSLDPARKKFMLDLQNMMQPEVFENQLKQSLIKFMVENPSEWKSAKTSAANPQSRSTNMMGLDFIQ